MINNEIKEEINSNTTWLNNDFFTDN
jgi:hypothetical protein